MTIQRKLTPGSSLLASDDPKDELVLRSGKTIKRPQLEHTMPVDTSDDMQELPNQQIPTIPIAIMRNEPHNVTQKTDRTKPSSSNQRILDSMHETTGLSKTALVRLIRSDASLNLPLKGNALSGLDLTNSPLEKVGSDIMAKFTVKSRHGNKWPFIFADYGTNMLWPYFGKSKDDLASSIKQFKREVVDKSGHEWRYLQSDAEAIYTDGDVKRLMDRLGITQQFSSPYRHDQNGLVERSPSMLEDTIKVACIILNECRLAPGTDQTPYELFYGSKPDYKNKVPFYQKGMSHVSEEQRKGKGKMEPKAEVVRFIGYAKNYKDAFLVFNPPLKRQTNPSIQHGQNPLEKLWIVLTKLNG